MKYFCFLIFLISLSSCVVVDDGYYYGNRHCESEVIIHDSHRSHQYRDNRRAYQHRNHQRGYNDRHCD